MTKKNLLKIEKILKGSLDWIFSKLTFSQNSHKICVKSVHNQNFGKIRVTRKFEPWNFELSLIEKISKLWWKNSLLFCEVLSHYWLPRLALGKKCHINTILDVLKGNFWQKESAYYPNNRNLGVRDLNHGIVFDSQNFKTKMKKPYQGAMLSSMLSNILQVFFSIRF